MENNEIWKPIKGFENYYQISNFGNVKRLNVNSKGVNTKYKNNDYCLKPRDNGKGYLRIKLTINNKSKRYMLHRLIATTFIENPRKFKVVNHINGIKKDNRLENLEWCTQSYNCKHFHKSKCMEPGIEKIGEKYQVRIRINGIRKSLGRYNSIEMAIKIRDIHINNIIN